ncbi:MAG: hypothetical protein ACJAYF_000909 [Arenicella sp.]|jgi:hypothetical protein
MNQRCRNCHFLAKTTRIDNGDEFTNSWGAKERESLELKDFYSPNCARGVWDAGVDPSINSRLKEVVDKDRAEACFFIETQDAMLFSAASELQKQRQENAQLRKGYRYTQVGLWLAAIGLIAGVVVDIVQMLSSGNGG